MGLGLLLLGQDRKEEAETHLARAQELAPELLTFLQETEPDA